MSIHREKCPHCEHWFEPDLGHPHDDALADIARLTAERDTALAQCKAWRKIADDLHFAYVNKDADCPHQFEISALDAYARANTDALPKPETQRKQPPTAKGG